VELKIRRGDIFYIQKGWQTIGSEQQSGRPAIIVSNEENNAHSQTVEVVYCTTRIKAELPTHTTVLSTPYESTVLCEQVTTVSVDRIGDYVGRCSEKEMREIDLCIMTSLGLSTTEMKRLYAERNQQNRTREKEDSEQKSDEALSMRIELDTYKRMYEIVVDKLASIAAGAWSKER
jgi:hypothetical protein